VGYQGKTNDFRKKKEKKQGKCQRQELSWHEANGQCQEARVGKGRGGTTRQWWVPRRSEYQKENTI
jgi:hypothetical protein